MSWSISTTVNHDAGNLQATLDQINEPDRSNVGNQQALKERDEQIDAAIKAAFALIVEGGFANAKEISVSISGHANQEHKKEIEWANDYISVQLHVSKYNE